MSELSEEIAALVQFRKKYRKIFYISSGVAIACNLALLIIVIVKVSGP